MTFVFTMPTPEESRAASANWLKPLRPCLYTHWPARFQELSFKTWVEVLTPADVNELTGYFDKPETPWTEALTNKLARGAAQFDTGCFFRLESRSPKDNYWGEATNFRACSWQDIRRSMWSERVMDDLARYIHLDDEPVRLLFREWHPIPKSEEFRCFIRDRKLVGISQYHYSGFDEGTHQNAPLTFALIVGRAAEIQTAITQFVSAEIIPNLHVDNLVVDLWADRSGKTTLIEINPYGLSDPCLLNYEELRAASECLFRFNQWPTDGAVP